MAAHGFEHTRVNSRTPGREANQKLYGWGQTTPREMSRLMLMIRDGKAVRLPAAELVPGDTVRLQSGDQVPADLRLIEVRDLRVAEAALTGESVPVEKAADPLPDDTPLAEHYRLDCVVTLADAVNGPVGSHRRCSGSM